MAGLLKKIHNILQQWNDILKSNNKFCSLHAQKHWKKLMQISLSSNKHENWKFSQWEHFFSKKIIIPNVSDLSKKVIDQYALPLDAIRLVFINGHFKSEFSTINTDPFIIRHHHDIDNVSPSLPEFIKSEFLLHLIESFCDKITHIQILNHNIAKRPLYLLHITSGRTKSLNMVNYRHHFELKRNTKAEIFEHYVTVDSTENFTSTRCTFKVGNNSDLNHIKLIAQGNNSYHCAYNDIIIDSNADINSTNFLTCTSLIRHNTSIQLNGENTKVALHSLSLPVNQQIIDIQTHVEHNQANCQSKQLHKTITMDQASAIFNGRIYVAKNASKTDSQMMIKNLLIGYSSTVETQPQLEIYNDDVKCSHGVTVGQLDDEQIFYLCTRGINKLEAKKMIIFAFMHESIQTSKNEQLSQFLLSFLVKGFLDYNHEF